MNWTMSLVFPLFTVLQTVNKHFQASWRNFGNRIASIFTRKKNKQLENINEQNQKTSPDSKRPTVSGPKCITNPLNDSPLQGDNFQRCTSYSLKSKNQLLPHTNAVAESTAFEIPEIRLQEASNHTNMEDKPKDINQFYKEMEEAVARKVKETMELADARRRALNKGTLITTQKQIFVKVENKAKEPVQEVAQTSEGLMSALDTSLHNITEHITNKINESKEVIDNEDLTADQQLKVEEIQQTLEDINKTVTETHEDLNRLIKDTKDVKDTETTTNKIDNVSQIGFEHFKTSVDVGDSDVDDSQMDIARNIMNPIQEVVKMEQIKTAPSFDEPNLQIGFEQFGDSTNSPLNRSLEETNDILSDKQEIAQGALHLAQNALRNMEGTSQEDTSEKRRMPEAPVLAQNTVKNNNNNNPFEIVEDANVDLRKMGERALSIAENASKSSTNPFESSYDEVETRKFNNDALNLALNASRDEYNPFYETDEEMEIKQLRQGALNVTHNATRSYIKNPFDEDDYQGASQLGADALKVAQAAARKVETEKRQMSEHAESIDNAFNSLIDSDDLQQPIVQIGFDYLANVLQEQTREADNKKSNLDFVNH